MYKNRYSKLLTILLIVAIVVIVTIVSIIVIRTIKKNREEADRIAAALNFKDEVKGQTNSIVDDASLDGMKFDENDVTNSDGQEGTRQVKYYKNFVMIGTLEIPVININLPILETETVASLEQSVAVRYPTNPVLNTKGNVVIAGHNYRNGRLFSNLKKVTVGTKLYVTDLTGKRLEYTVYEVYETTPEDAAYITKNVGGNIEVTLVTCTNDSKARTIVCAKAN